MPPGPRNRSFDFTATKKPRQTHRHAEEESTTATKTVSPTSINTIIVATEASTQTHCLPLVLLADVQLQRRSPQEGIQHKGAAIVRSQGSRVSPEAAPPTRCVREGCGSNAAMPPRRSTTAAAAASPAKNRERVFHPKLATHPQPHNNLHQR
jgi:hypothetical protein